MSDRCRVRILEAAPPFSIALGLVGDLGPDPKNIALFTDDDFSPANATILPRSGISAATQFRSLAAAGDDFYYGYTFAPNTAKADATNAIILQDSTAKVRCIAAGGGRVFALVDPSNTLVEINTATLAHTPISIIGLTDPLWIYSSATDLWIVDDNYANIKLTSWNLSSGLQGATFNIESLAGAALNPSGLAVSDNGKYAAVPMSTKLWVFDLSAPSLLSGPDDSSHSIESNTANPCVFNGNVFYGATANSKSIVRRDMASESALTVVYTSAPGDFGGADTAGTWYNTSIHPLTIIR